MTNKRPNKKSTKKVKRIRKIKNSLISLTFVCFLLFFAYHSYNNASKFFNNSSGSFKSDVTNSKNSSKAKNISSNAEGQNTQAPDTDSASANAKSLSSSQKNKLTHILDNPNAYTDDLIEMVKLHPETIDFVYNYPEEKNTYANTKSSAIDISNDIPKNGVPLFIQWDKRWGYSSYGDNLFAVNGCGPTCLSMVAVALTGDKKMNPKWMAKFSEDNGYISENGTAWALMSDGAEKIGLNVTQIPLDKNRIISNLEVGNPIICSMGPGDFTTQGHFIVLTGIKDGKICVNDPNSKSNSSKLWTLDKIMNQIKNLWVYR